MIYCLLNLNQFETQYILHIALNLFYLISTCMHKDATFCVIYNIYIIINTCCYTVNFTIIKSLGKSGIVLHFVNSMSHSLRAAHFHFQGRATIGTIFTMFCPLSSVIMSSSALAQQALNVGYDFCLQLCKLF